MNWFFLLLIFIHRIMIYVYVQPPPPSHSSSFCSSFQTNARAQEMHMDDESILQKAMYSSSTVRLSLPLHRIDEEILCFSLLKASLMEYADTYTHTYIFLSNQARVKGFNTISLMDLLSLFSSFGCCLQLNLGLKY